MWLRATHWISDAAVGWNEVNRALPANPSLQESRPQVLCLIFLCALYPLGCYESIKKAFEALKLQWLRATITDVFSLKDGVLDSNRNSLKILKQCLLGLNIPFQHGELQSKLALGTDTFLIKRAMSQSSLLAKTVKCQREKAWTVKSKLD